MITDTIGHAHLYFSQTDDLYCAIEFARAFDPALPDGTYWIDGRIRVLVSSYTGLAPEEKRFERHKQFIDVQTMLDGEELCGHSLDETLEPITTYDSQTDLQFFKASQTYNHIVIRPGEFAVYFPQDFHMPGCFVSEPKPVRKIVVKVPVERTKE